MNQNTAQHDDTAVATNEQAPATPHMIWSRTVEMAVNAGRRAIHVNLRDYEQAKRDLAGEALFGH